MNFKNFWYIAAESHELRDKTVLPRIILDEWIALFRDSEGKPVALLDQCMHRGSQISGGKVINGCLQCPYHGWTYDCEGRVVQVPSEGPGESTLKRKNQRSFEVIEQEGFIYVRLEKPENDSITPFKMPHYGEKGWKRIRLQNRFQNNVVNCAENFVDIPHTVFVHPGIFRRMKNQKIEAEVRRENGSVVVTYENETDNFGFFSKFLNPSGEKIQHVDSYHMPNVTCVKYTFGPKRIFYITSQSIPVHNDETLVYTDLTYDYGIWNHLAAPIVKRQGQMIIDQDIEILANQMKTIKKYGEKFNHSQADVIHILIESVYKEIEAGRDPRVLSPKKQKIEFWV